MDINIGQSRPRGQPKKTASALTKQIDVKLSSDSSDSPENESPDPSPLKKIVKKNFFPKNPHQKNVVVNLT